MDKKTKIIIGIGIAVILAGVIFYFYNRGKDIELEQRKPIQPIDIVEDLQDATGVPHIDLDNEYEGTIDVQTEK